MEFLTFITVEFCVLWYPYEIFQKLFFPILHLSLVWEAPFCQKKSKSLYPNVHPRNLDRLKKGIVQSCIWAMTTHPRLSEKKLVVFLLRGFKTWSSVLHKSAEADVQSSDPSSANSARSHPQTRLHFSHDSATSHPQTRLHLIHKLGYISSMTRLHLIHKMKPSG